MNDLVRFLTGRGFDEGTVLMSRGKISNKKNQKENKCP
jgi:hypothetical protein